jgi:hypothetical protein
MTEAGKMVLAIYSLVVVAVLIFVNGRRLIRGGSMDWSWRYLYRFWCF